MLTTEEQILLTGRDDEIVRFIDDDRCVVLDWRGTEEEVLVEIRRFLPAGVLLCDTTFPGTETVAMRIRFRGREHAISLPLRPQNNFRVLLRVWRLLQPDYDIKLFRCTDDSDTPAFLLRPAAWWAAFRAADPERGAKVFREVGDLNELWELDAARKRWWKFW